MRTHDRLLLGALIASFALVLAGLSVAIWHDARVAVAREAEEAVPARFEVKVVGYIEDDNGNRHAIRLLTDTQTGREYIAVTDMGLVEVTAPKREK